MKSQNRYLTAIPLLLSLLVLAGCALAPKYERPEVAVPAAFKEAASDPASVEQWKTAQPAEAQARGEWWKVFNDATLDELETQAATANQSLKAAAARLLQSRALQQTARAGLFPQVNAGFGPTRQRPSPASQGLPADADTQASTLWRAQAGVSYEVDLFGRVAANVDAAQATAEQNEALFRSVQLALQADVAQGYFQLRELDAERALFLRTVSLREATLALVQKRFDAGDISELDLARSRTELASAQAELQGSNRSRATAEHALAILLGKAPAEFALAPNALMRISISVPAGLPSSLLERRPDIAAAERAMAAANARIGVARSAFFPNLTLTGAAGVESGQLSNLFQWSSRTFLLGPIAGTMLSLPIFDGGSRQAGVDRARAAYEEDVANYRQTVLNAFREVEDNLATLRILAEQMRAQDDAVKFAARAAQLSQTQYREGLISYLDVIDADRSVLAQQHTAAQLDGERARSTVALIRALGGEWAKR